MESAPYEDHIYETPNEVFQRIAVHNGEDKTGRQIDRPLAPPHPVSQPVQDLKPKLTIVLLGQTGTGKSASGNTILAACDPPAEPFVSKASSLPVTQKCADFEGTLFDTPIQVVDTPDFFGEDVKEPEEQMVKCRQFCGANQHVFLLVLKTGPFSEPDVLRQYEKALDMEIRDDTIVLLTHSEKLKRTDLQHFIRADKHLRSVVEDCGNRCHRFKNNSRQPTQVIELLKLIPNYQRFFPRIDEINKTKDKVKEVCVTS